VNKLDPANRFLFLILLVWCGFATRPIRAVWLDYPFNEGSGTAASASQTSYVPAIFYATNGVVMSNAWSAPGGGVSTVSSDFSFDTTSASGMGTQQRGPHLRLAIGVMPLLSNFTITGWFRPTSEDLGRAILIRWSKPGTNLSLVGLSGGPTGARSRLRLSVGTSPIQLHTLEAASGFESTFSTPNQWAFFAVVVDATSQPCSATFFHGSMTSTAIVSLVTTRSTLLPLDLSDTTMTIGSGEFFQDPLQGHLDNIAVFTDSLTLPQVEQVRLRALTPERLRMAGGQLRWPTLPGRVYQLESSENMQQWEDLGPSAVGDGQDMIRPVISEPGTKRFFRLRFN
jgi:hypothetical protein